MNIWEETHTSNERIYLDLGKMNQYTSEMVEIFRLILKY